DLATSNYGSNTVSVRLGDGTGGFTGTTNLAVQAGPEGIVSGDFDGDGNLDLAVANISASSVSFLYGDGTGTFSAATHRTGISGATRLATGDFNNDRHPDIAVFQWGGSAITLLLNQPFIDVAAHTPTANANGIAAT